MPDIIHLDYETRSRAQLGGKQAVGTYKYAEDPSTEIFCAAFADNDKEPVVWINPKFEMDTGLFCIKSEISDTEMRTISQSISVNHDEVWAHNAQFECAITKYQGAKHGIFIDDSAWRCTAALSRRAGIPASLEMSAHTLGLMQQKDKGGKSLIQRFSVPKKSTGKFLEPQEDPYNFKRFIEYCRQDVRVEQQIHKELAAFNLTHAGMALDSFLLDLRINARGLEVNRQVLMHVQDLINAQEADLASQFRDITGFNASQQKVFMVWLKEQGYQGDNIRAATMEEEFTADDFDPDSLLGRALTIRKKLSFASIKKVKAMIRCACSDGRVRGSLQYYGAGTGRSAGRLIQPQNFKRSTKTSEMAYHDMCNGASTRHLELCYGPMMEVVSNSIRHFIHPHEGVLLDVDFSSIEARLVNWLAGQDDATEEFRQKIDRYKKMASVIYGVPADEVNDFPQRFVGKQATLGCGYQMSGHKFRITCKNYGYDLPWTADIIVRKTGEVIQADIPVAEADAWVLKQKNLGIKKYRVLTFEDRCVRMFRKTHKEVVKFWYACDKAAKAAIGNPNTKFPVGKVTFFSTTTAGAKYLFIRLPSGRRLAYRDPRIMLERKPVADDAEDWEWDEIEEDEEGKETKVQFRERITYWSQLEGKQIWGHVSTYGGSIVENICQAIAADLLSNGCIKAEAAGIEIATLIHDQVLAYCRNAAEAQAKLTILEACMTDLPEWAAGLPVAVEGKITKYYKK